MVGIVILNFNTADDVISCVRSIKEKTATEYKIYIVDNGSTDGSYEKLFNIFSDDADIDLTRSDVNGGFSAGNNIGIKRAVKDGCEYICIINADILLINDAITVLENKLKENADLGVATPSIASPDSDEESQFARYKLTFENFLAEKTFLRNCKRFCKKYPRYAKSEEKFDEDYVFFGMTYGCMYIVRADFLVKADYLDEAVFLFNEEDILAYKLERYGLKTLISPDAKVLHNHHSSIKKTSFANRIYNFRVSELIVLRRYDGVSMIKLMPIIWVFKLSWALKSLKYDDYKRLKKKFFTAMNGIKKIKKREGLEELAE